MSESDCRVAAPSAEEIEKRFASLPIRTARPLLHMTMHGLRIVRRFRWNGVGVGNIPLDQSPVIFASSHDSHVDTAAILGTLPKAMRDRTAVAAALDVFGPNGKRLIRSIPNASLQFLVASSFHAFAFDRHGPPLRSIRTSKKLVECGWNLLLYPEGTRGQPGKIGPFKAGIGLLARFTGRPVVPIFVHGGRDVLPVGGFLPQPGTIRVYYGKPLHYEGDDTPDGFAHRMRDAVLQLRSNAVGASTGVVADDLSETESELTSAWRTY